MSGAILTLPYSPASERWVETVTASELAAVQWEWQELADGATEPNLFYEPWMMLPALEAFHPKANLRVFLVWERDGARRRLAALFPFEQRPLRAVSLVRFRLLRYYYCSLCTPLVRSRDAVLALLDELQRRRDGIYELSLIDGEGPVCQWLSGAVTAERWCCRRAEKSRALFRPAADAETYLRAVLKGNRRRDLKRLERRLSEHGTLLYDELAADAPAAPWIDEFLALEAGGWKGERGSALARVPNAPGFFHHVAAEAHRRGRLVMSALRLEGRAVAMNCLLRSGDGLYAFRTAYSEAFARYSPGTLLSLHDTRRAHEAPLVRWIDSCADPGSQTVNQLWKKRRPLVALQIAPRGSLVGLVLAATKGGGKDGPRRIAWNP